MPIASPAMVAIAKPSSPASSAAASAGTTSRLDSVGSSLLVMPAIRIIAPPARTEAMIQLSKPSRSGESPVRIAPFSFAAAARVANPKRVNRNTAPRPMATAIARPASTKLAVGTTTSPNRTTPSGSSEVSCSDAEPAPVSLTRSCMTDCR